MRIEQNKDNQREWDRFCKLGEMIGDGLHYESDGKWISKEYKQLAKILIPELKVHHKADQKQRSLMINEQMTKLLSDKKCHCGGNIKQKRSGAKVAYCENCNSRYVAKPKK